ncbi:hypothetical protein [Stenotrophomonas sepilia]|uniref:hypothetical protein n=1 Tax=Stenotrophomonas sepilia TaxID=2860290 RepID=UPI002FE52743
MPTQSDLRFTFVVGDVDFDVVEFTLEEGLSETYRLDLALISFDPAIDFGQVSSTAPSTAARCATTPPPAAMRPRPPGPWYLPHFGPERYLKHIDQAAWQEALQESARHTELKQQELDTSTDFCTVIQSTSWKQQQRTDFSPHPASALGHEDMVASCMAGSGVTEQEQQQLWDPVLNLSDDDPDNWLARALGSLDTSYAAHLKQTPTEQDDAYVAAKEAVNLTRTFLANGEKRIREIRANIRTQRAANANTATLIETSAGHLFRLRDKNPKAYRKLIRQVTLALITRADLVPTPTLVRGTLQQTTQMWMAVLHGDPRIVARAPVAVTRGSTTGRSTIQKPALSSAIQGAVVLAPPNSRQEAIATVAWVVKKIEQGGHLDYDQLRKLKLTELNLTARAAAQPTQSNPVLQNHLVRMGRGVDAVLGAGALFFQVLQGADMMKQYSIELNPDSKAEADYWAGMTVSVLGAISASIELYVAVRVLGENSKAALSRIRTGGALIGAAASVVDGMYTILKGWNKRGSGDIDSGNWSIASGAAFTVAGVATLFALGGPVGWTLLLIGAIGVGLFCAWQAYATDDENLTPVEYWLDNGVFGKGEFRSGKRARQNPYAEHGQVLPFTHLEDETMALQKVVLVAQARFTDLEERFTRFATFTVDLPRYAEGSRLELKFHGYQGDRRLDVGEMSCQCPDEWDRAVRPRAERLDNTHFHYELSEKLMGRRFEPEMKVDNELGTARIQGRFTTADPDGMAVYNRVKSAVEWLSSSEIEEKWHVDRFGMTLRYWPNKKEMPNLVSEFTYPLAEAERV